MEGRGVFFVEEFMRFKHSKNRFIAFVRKNIIDSKLKNILRGGGTVTLQKMVGGGSFPLSPILSLE